MPRSHQPTLAGFDDAADLLPPPVAAAPQTADCQSPDETPKLAGKTVYVVDSHSLIYQDFHALPEMSGPSGQPVGAVLGFVRDLLDLIEVRSADFLICAFDESEVTFRNEIYDQYKRHREPMPPDLQLQIPVIRRFLGALGILTLSLPGYEADDILATIAKQVDAAGGRCLLVTSDKDCRQLITDRVQLYNIRKNEIFDAAALQKIWGIRPDQVVDFQALVGDPTDNIPGVALIGPKIAQELLTKYETLDAILNHASEISGAKRKENLLNGREIALKSRELARLRTDLDIVVDWSAAGVGHFNIAAIADLCHECGFRQLARRIETLTARLAAAQPHAIKPPAPQPADEETAEPAAPIALESASSHLTTATSPDWKANYRAITSLAELEQLAALLAKQPQISFDTETTSVCARAAELVGLSFAWATGEACYVPIKAPPGEPQLDLQAVLQIVRPILENPAIAKIGQNLKYDIIVLRAVGVDVRGVSFDSMVADLLLEPGERSHGMDDMARRHLCHQTITIDQLIGSGKKQKRMDEVPVSLIAEYANWQ